MRLIIAIQKKVGLHGLVVRGFRYDSRHSLHIWEGKEFEPEDFNKIAKEVFHRNDGLAPFALVVGAGEEQGKSCACDCTALKSENEKLKEEVATLRAALNPAASAAAVEPAVATPRQKKAQKGEAS